MPAQNTFKTTWIVSVLLYICLIAGVSYSMFTLRSWTLKNCTTEESLSNWGQWRTETKRLSGTAGPVQRRVAKKTPPLLALMVEYFWTSWIAAIVILSVIYATFTFLLIGAFGKSNTSLPVKTESK